MAYRIEKTQGGQTLVIDGWENGIAASPYQGIANMRGLNTNYYAGVAYGNYQRKAATLSGSAIIDEYAPSNFSANFALYSGSIEYLGQPFHNSIATNFNQADFYLSKTGSPTGNITAYLYGASIFGAQYYPYSPPNIPVSYLVVGGGGQGGWNDISVNSPGGGGGGAQVKTGSTTLSSKAYTITVGTGGTGGSLGSNGADGTSSSFDSITSSPGLGGVTTAGAGGNSGSGNTGGAGSPGGGPGDPAGGGGAGDSGNGTGASVAHGGNAGTGTANALSGSSVNYGAGAPGGGTTPGTGGNGNPGSGGAGGDPFGDPPSNGQNGVVIISAPTGLITATGGTHTTSGGNDIWTFTTSGTWTITSPAVNIIATSSTVSASTLTGTPTLTSFNFSSTPLTANTFYILVIKYTGGDSSDTVNVGYGITSEYVGNVSLFSDDGTAWSQTSSPAVSNLIFIVFPTVTTVTMGNPVQGVQSPAGLDYILDSNGNVWKQTAVNSTEFDMIQNTGRRFGNGNKGLAYWNNYLVIFGDGMIEFNGDGTGDAGINSSNWNLAGPTTSVELTPGLYSMSGVGVPTSPNNFVFATGPTMGSASATLSADWTGPSGAFPVGFANGSNDVRTVTFTNGSTSVSWSGGLSNDAGTSFTMYQLAVTPNTFSGYEAFDAGNLVTFSTTGTLPTGLTAGTQYYLQQDVDLSGLITTFYVSIVATGLFQDAVMITDAGSGTLTMSLVPSIVPPIENTTITDIGWSTPGTGSTTILLPTEWLGATGVYNIIDTHGNNMLGLFTYSSDIVTLLNPAIFQDLPTATYLVQIVNPSATTNRTWVSKTDGNLYYANGRWVGRIQSSPNPNIKFNPGIPVSYSVNYAVTGTLQPQDTVVDLTDLRGQLIILGNQDAYPWDYVSAQPAASFPIGEQTYAQVNILNNVYILAGQKGNIYVTNGYSAQLMYKLPEYIAGVIDPAWTWGGLMFHRAKLFFQATASSNTGTPILAGIFSLIVSPSLTGEIASGLVLEEQNSFGLIPASTNAAGVLLDDVPSATGFDSFYSAWSNGTGVGGIDYNDTTLSTTGTSIIEMDMIPLATVLEKGTLGIIEFKLDREMVTGDSITINYRGSVSESYQFLGTTTTNVLSDYYTSGINTVQWLQLEAVFTYAASGSSRIPLREVRIHINS